jgi:hypothetical protein
MNLSRFHIKILDIEINLFGIFSSRILLSSLLLIFLILISGCASKEKDIGSFSQCLTDRGAVLYGASWCGHCQQQKTLFGEHIDKINYVECTQEKSVCEKEGIRGYPTWKLNGQLYPGSKTLDKLSLFTGCNLYGNHEER